MASYSQELEKGNYFCSRIDITPMHPKNIQIVKNIYHKCSKDKWCKLFYNTPLIFAALCGHKHIVWAFIECAKQTNTDLHTGEVGKFLQFLGHTTSDGNTALHMAALYDRVDVVKLLLRYASLELLSSYRNDKGKTPLSMLQDPKYDRFIFEVLEATTGAEVHTPTSIVSIDDIQESKVYSDSIMDPNSYPISHTNHTRNSLHKLDHGQLELSANKSTILHLVVKFGDVNYVKDILQRHPSLIYMRNSHGETPAYVAASYGHLDILAIMIKHFQAKNDDIELLVTRSMDKRTALHIAIENHHVGVVFLLEKEVPRLANSINDFGESSLYIAAERRYHRIILELTKDKRTEKVFDGPNGRTALHAAAISGSQGCIKHLLSANVDLLYVRDKNGLTSLDYALYHNNSDAATMLLSKDASVGYQIMTDGKAAIHIAASRGNLETMKSLISDCPGCFELTDSKGRNILHLAVENKKIEVIEFILKNESLTSLINQKDNDGNTPIHLLMASDIEKMEEFIDYRVNVNVLNNDKRTPLDMASSQEKREKLLKGIAKGTSKHNKTLVLSSESNKYKEIMEAEFVFEEKILLVATLIATATFAAAFTMPGGFDNNQGSTEGTPILLRKAAFQAFVISNTIAFACSCSALGGHIVLILYRDQHDEVDMETLKEVRLRLANIYNLTGLAMLTMSIAFITGIYVVLTPSLGLAIFVCVITLCIIFSTLAFPNITWSLSFKFLSIIRIMFFLPLE